MIPTVALAQINWFKWIGVTLAVSLALGSAYMLGRVHEARHGADQITTQAKQIVQLVEEKGKVEARLREEAAIREAALLGRSEKALEGLKNAIVGNAVCDLTDDELFYYDELVNSRTYTVPRSSD